ncbi:MAG: RDD family protein [Candidatus Saliniplasma sp.]
MENVEEKKVRFWSIMPEKDKDVSIIDAGLISRGFAFFIDLTIIKVSTLLILGQLAAMGWISPDAVFEIFVYRTNIYEDISLIALFTSTEALLVHILFSLYLISYFVILESKYVWGTTLGKRLLKLSVVNSQAEKLTLRESLLRNSTKYLLRVPMIGIPFGLLELILVMFYSKRTGDILVNTFVARDVHKGAYYEGE